MITFFFLVKQENNIIENCDVTWARIEMRMRNFSEYIHTTTLHQVFPRGATVGEILESTLAEKVLAGLLVTAGLQQFH